MEKVKVETTVNVDAKKAWESFTEPRHIMKWNSASDDWHCPASTNDVRPGGKFSATMAARDGSMSFDFEGVYDEVDPGKSFSYTMADDRRCEVTFSESDGKTTVTEIFDAENMNPVEMQREGWQSILEKYKKYTEENL